MCWHSLGSLLQWSKWSVDGVVWPSYASPISPNHPIFVSRFIARHFRKPEVFSRSLKAGRFFRGLRTLQLYWTKNTWTQKKTPPTFSLTLQELLCSRSSRYSSRHWQVPTDSWEISVVPFSYGKKGELSTFPVHLRVVIAFIHKQNRSTRWPAPISAW